MARWRGEGCRGDLGDPPRSAAGWGDLTSPERGPQATGTHPTAGCGEGGWRGPLGTPQAPGEPKRISAPDSEWAAAVPDAGGMRPRTRRDADTGI